jgi:hypothetical protein
MQKKSKKPKKLTLFLKFGISIAWDILDMTIFRMPVLGTLTDIIAVPISVALWGPLGYAYAWEIFDLTDQFDAEIPTMTIIGIVSTFKANSFKM